MIRAIFILSALFLGTIYSYTGDPVIVISNTQSPQVQVSWKVDTGKMKDTQLYDMLARYYGAPRVSTSEQLRIDIDLFDRPQGHLLFSIDGLSSKQLVRSDYKTLGTEKLVDVVSKTVDGKPYSVMGAVLTGTSGNVNGGVYTVGNFYDAMRKVYGGKVMVSGAGTKEGAMVLSPHSQNFGFSTKAHYWEPKIKSFVSVVGSSSYTIGINDFPRLMKDLAIALNAEVKYSEEDHMVTIARGSEELVSYDLTSVEEEALFAELLFVVNMVHNPVDFFSFHFNSLVSIISKFGAASDEYDVAVQMIDAVIARIKSAYATYSNYETTIIYFPETYRSKDVISTVEACIVNENIRTEIQSPSLYIFFNAVESSKFEEICSTLRTDLADLNVNCHLDAPLKRSLQNDSEPSPAPTPEPEPQPPSPPSGNATQQEIELVHIVLWLVIAMIAALVQACYHLAVLDGSNEPEFKAKNYEGAGIRSKTHKM